MPTRRVLIRLGSLGDVVLATAAASAARDLWGQGCLDVLVKEEWREIWDGHPAVHEVLLLRPEDRGMGGLRTLAGEIRRRGYAEALDLQASARTRALCALAGLPARRPRRHEMRRRLLARVHRFGPPAGYRVVNAFVDCVNPGAETLPVVQPGAQAMERARAALPDREGVGLVPGARHATKRWPLERWVALAHRLESRGRRPVVFLGPDDAPLEAAWTAAWGSEAWDRVRGGLGFTAACLSRLALAVTNDTGLMHLAAAAGTPVVALFGPTVRSFGFTPAGAEHRVLEVQGLSCRPCSVHGGVRCPKGHFRCMLDLGVAEVEEAVLAALRRAPAPRAASREGA